MKTGKLLAMALCGLVLGMLAWIWIGESGALGRMTMEENNKTLCMFNLMDIQLAVRTHQKENKLVNGTPLAIKDVIKGGYLQRAP